MKKYISIFLTAIFVLSCFSGCGASASATADKAASAAADGNDKIQIVTTIFPEYDWVKNVLGDNPAGAEVTMLLDNGVDLHSFQPTAEDILKISTSDVFIYVGGESDDWVDDALKEAVNKDMKVINLLEVLGEDIVEEEVVEGMQEGEHAHEHEHDEDHDHDEDEDHDDHDHDADEDHDDDEHDQTHEHGEEPEYDEHVWLSLESSEELVEAIAKAISEADPENAETYKKNADEYKAKLEALDEQYEEVVEGSAQKTILFGDRFPFRYMVDDYDLEYYAAFVGCSAETEASFETVTFLANKVDELGLKAVLTIENSDQKIAKTIVENTTASNQQILTMDSMQSTTSKDVEGGASYLSAMEKNLEVLKEALK
ncbi:MAG: metal ABC transporter substrate-binding protein [Lachnospiraceae bacterium]|nr:metal ABC transporter substrate-binding protein [Lachnospiraceae bacterium]